MRHNDNKKIKRMIFDKISASDSIPQELFDFCYLAEYEKGEMIIKKRRKPENLYYLVNGSCSIASEMINGECYIQSFVKSPALLGELELLEEKESVMDVKTLEDCLLIVFPFSTCRNRLLDDNGFLKRLCKELIQKERKASIRLLQINAYPFKNRLALFILNNAQGDDFHIKKADISRVLGISYRHTEKVMKDLVEANILEKKGTHYRILKREQLEHLSEALADEMKHQR